MDPIVDADADTERLMLCQPVGDGWAVFVGFQSFGGVVEVVEEALVYVGDEDSLEDITQRRQEAMIVVPSVPPSRRMTEVRRREVVGRGVNSARRWVAENPGIANFLFHAGWARDVAAPRKFTDRDYAERAAVFVATGKYGDLAAAYFVEPSTAKSWMEEARRRDLLTKPGRGKRGLSTLTPQAVELLKGAE